MKILAALHMKFWILPLALFGGIEFSMSQNSLITYQGQLAAEGRPAEGDYSMRFCLYENVESERALWCDEQRVAVRNGLFTVQLGANPQNSLPLEAFRKYEGRLCLEIIVERERLLPRQLLSAAPFAFYAQIAKTADAVFPGAIQDNAVNTTALAAGAVTSSKIASGQVVKSLNTLKDDVALVAGANITLATNGNALQISAAVGGGGTGWSLTGNAGTTAGVNFLGTTDSQPLELKVNNARVLRLEGTGDSTTDSGALPDGAPNVVAGSPVNAVAAGVVGATISGGGATNFNGANVPQMVLSDYATVGGGAGNQVADSSYFSVISGGYSNQIGRSVAYATISGGIRNSMDVNADYSTIGGGNQNIVLREVTASFIGGGRGNRIEEYSDYATIAGGYQNAIGGRAGWSVIGGGNENIVLSNSYAVTIAGGYGNQTWKDTDYSTIGGGQANHINDNAWYATIGGGFDNTILEHSNYAMIPGGYGNTATNLAFAAGRYAHAIHTGSFVWADSARTGVSTYSYARDSVTFRAAGGYRFYTSSGSAGATLAAGGGSWTSLSDRNAKEDFRPVSSSEVLEKVTTLPVQTWSYKTQDATIRHIGPTSQDFQAAFAVGESDTGITTVDADGVALAAIQGLNQKVEERSQELETRSRKLEAENTELRQRLEQLEQLMNSITQKSKGAAE